MSNLTIQRVTGGSGALPANATAWAGSLAQNAGSFARLLMPEGVGAGRNGKCLIRSIAIVSDEQLDYEFWFWANQQGQYPGHPDIEQFLGFWSFSVAGGDGKQIAATGRYYYYIDGLSIPYHDEDGHNAPTLGTFLNVTLVNRSAASKTASNWFQVAFGLEPTLGS